jgi:hypothetical protein
MLRLFSTEPAMQSYDFYFSAMVFGAFAVFGLGLAINYIQYRRWLKRPESRR